VKTRTEGEAAVVRLLNDIETLRRSLRLYPSSHPALQPARARIRERADAVGQAGETATASFGPATVSWNGAEIALPANAPASRLVTMLFHAAVASMNLRFPAACEGLADLAGLLADLHDPPGEADRVRFFAAAESLPGVELVSIDLSDVRLLPSDEELPRPGTRLIWAELAHRLSRDGSFPLAGKVHTGELSPGKVLELAESAGEVELLFDHLFTQLGEIVRSSPLDQRPVTLQEVREFFDELVFLLTPERRKLAVVAAVRHLPVVGTDDPWVAADLLMDAVEFMLVQEVAVPDTVQRALHALAAPQLHAANEAPEEITARARLLLARLPATDMEDVTTEVIPQVPLRVDWRGEPHAQELVAELAEDRIRRGLILLLEETGALWPDQPVARRATVRLAEELGSAVEIGDLTTASRLVARVAASHDPEVGQAVAHTVIPAAVRAFKVYDRRHHQDLKAILVTLGEGALPAILQALADEETLAVRRRLLEVIEHHRDRGVPFILPLLNDPRWYVVRNAALLLRRIRARETAAELKIHARGAHPKVLAEILKALVAMDDPDWLTVLLASLDSPDPETRTVAAEVAGTVANPQVVSAVIERLRPRIGNALREPFALALIRALGQLRDPAGLPLLQEILALKQWRYPFSLDAARREAAVAVAHLPGDTARRQALALAADRDEELAAAVKEALRWRPASEDEE
jgi:hypothetical protein